MENKAPSKKKEFSRQELNSFFKKLDQGGQLLPSAPVPDNGDMTSDWITTSGSSKQSNKLIKILAWQTGQTS